LDASLSHLTIVEPFMPLYHFKDQLENYVEDKRKALKEDPKLPICDRERDLFEHIAPLFHFLDNRPESAAIKLERERHKKGMCTFKMLWLLYQPGTRSECFPPDNSRFQF
jgi:hypothetical protein